MAHDAVRADPIVKTATGWRSVVRMGSPVSPIVAAVLEEGRRPGQRPPPVSAILPWVERRLGDRVAGKLKGARVSAHRRASIAKRAALARRNLKSGKWTATQARAHERGGFAGRVVGVNGADAARAMRSTAFLVARSIGRKGTPGLHMFRIGARLMRGGRAQRIVRDAMQRAFSPSRGGRR